METERIKEMFESNDGNLRKLAQKICHELRIDYWICYWIDNVHRVTLAMGFEDVYVIGNKDLETEFKVTRRNLHGFENNVKFYKVKLNGERTKKNQEKIRDS